MMFLIGSVFIFLRKLINRLLCCALKGHFNKLGRNVKFFALDSFSFKTIEIGDDVFIGKGANFSASNSKIIIGCKVMFGPNVTIMGGDHNTSVIGQYMFDVKEKLPENDLPVIISNDVWVGCNVTILKGVTIGEGSVLAAGSVITANVPPYSIVGGVPAKVIGTRFTKEVIEKHKVLLESC